MLRVKVDLCGAVVIPDAILRQLGIEAGAFVILTPDEDGRVIIRPSQLRECDRVARGGLTEED